MASVKRLILTGTPPYDQDYITNHKNRQVMAGCGPVAALILMSYYDRRHGYKRLIPSNEEMISGMPKNILLKLRQKMKTSYYGIKGRDKQWYGLTLPGFFRSGLRSYIKDFYNVSTYTKASTGFNTLKGVFEKSVELLDQGKVHVMLLDYEKKKMWKKGGRVIDFPTHYVVVVGYNKSGSKNELVINNGLGDNFEIIDMKDKGIKPARIYWISMKEEADGARDAHEIGPDCNYNWSGGNLIPDGINWGKSDKAYSYITNSEIKKCVWYK